jgi:hypothetical protein
MITYRAVYKSMIKRLSKYFFISPYLKDEEKGVNSLLIVIYEAELSYFYVLCLLMKANILVEKCLY